MKVSWKNLVDSIRILGIDPGSIKTGYGIIEFSGKRTTGGLRRAGNPRAGIHDRELPKYTQIGNAVPVKLAYEVGKHFWSKLKI